MEQAPAHLSSDELTDSAVHRGPLRRGSAPVSPISVLGEASLATSPFDDSAMIAAASADDATSTRRSLLGTAGNTAAAAAATKPAAPSTLRQSTTASSSAGDVDISATSPPPTDGGSPGDVVLLGRPTRDIVLPTDTEPALAAKVRAQREEIRARERHLAMAALDGGLSARDGSEASPESAADGGSSRKPAMGKAENENKGQSVAMAHGGNVCAIDIAIRM